MQFVAVDFLQPPGAVVAALAGRQLPRQVQARPLAASRFAAFEGDAQQSCPAILVFDGEIGSVELGQVQLVAHGRDGAPIASCSFETPQPHGLLGRTRFQRFDALGGVCIAHDAVAHLSVGNLIDGGARVALVPDNHADDRGHDDGDQHVESGHRRDTLEQHHQQ